MSGHTPGPWTVANDGTQITAVHPRRKHAYDIVTVHYAFEHDQFKANAKLIAAAPCLAKALHEVMKMIGCECDCIHSDDSNPTQCPCKLARAALAKAGVA